ncbi:flavin-containing monooxygenase [Pedococcus sp. 2YAF34]|uniref:flavin-containing monooxygenase n=1 Tax=Pedococcus sp. 2YAF34 TaxID=3233032 RepID=UPI003F99114C
MTAPHHRVVIVGTGFSGLGMAIRLSQRGERDFVLLEKADDIGGTWRDNRYPGCACDVPSRLYSFSFDQKADWSRDYAPAPEIWAYLQDVARRHGVRDRVVLGADLRQARYDVERRRWELTAADGREWTADALVLGVGGLHQPARPDIEGLDDFAGALMHTAQWPEDDGLDGLRVGVVGTGASAVQLVPELAPRAAHTTVFQRTPAWTMPKKDVEWSPRHQRLFRRFPVLQRAVRWRTYWELEARAPLFVRFPALARLGERVALRELRKAVRDPEVRDRLTPRYRLGCKRILLSSTYWPTFDRDDVSLVTEPIARVEPDAVVTADGARHEVDALVLGTGFALTGSFDRIAVTGLDGRTLAQEWSTGAHTHLGVTVAGFPELYLLLGPNTGLGHSSVVMMSEFATRYALQGIERARAAGARVTSDSAQAAFTAEMERRTRHTVWASGCRSWYLDRFGHNTALWPGSTLAYWWRTRRIDDSVFVPVTNSPTAARTKETIDA